MFLSHVQTVQFDPSNKKHREAVRAFMRRGAWVDTEMRFTHDPAHSSVSAQVQTKLLQWYMFQEGNRSRSAAPKA